MASVELRGLTKRYGEVAVVDDVSLTIEQADQPAVLDGERHVVDHRNLSITLGQAPQFNRRHAHPPRRPAGCSAAAVFDY